MWDTNQVKYLLDNLPKYVVIKITNHSYTLMEPDLDFMLEYEEKLNNLSEGIDT